MSRYVIIGAGAIGSFLAAGLCEAGIEQVLVARGADLEALRRDGLRVRRGHRLNTVAVAVAAGPAEVKLTGEDVLVITTKTQDVEQASAAWAWQPVTDAEGIGFACDLPIVSLQNGLAADQMLLRRFRRVIGGTILTPAVHLEPGAVETVATQELGSITLGVVAGASAGQRESIAADFRQAGYAVDTCPDVARWQRTKLLNSVRNGLEVLTASPEQLAVVSSALVTEAREVFAAAGLSVADPAERQRSSAQERPEVGFTVGRRSAWQSFERGSSSEIDYLNGEISLLGRRFGVETPFNTALQTVLGVAAQSHDRPGQHHIDEVIALAGADRGAFGES